MSEPGDLKVVIRLDENGLLYYGGAVYTKLPDNILSLIPAEALAAKSAYKSHVSVEQVENVQKQEFKMDPVITPGLGVSDGGTFSATINPYLDLGTSVFTHTKVKSESLNRACFPNGSFAEEFDVVEVSAERGDNVSEYIAQELPQGNFLNTPIGRKYTHFELHSLFDKASLSKSKIEIIAKFNELIKDPKNEKWINKSLAKAARCSFDQDTYAEWTQPLAATSRTDNSLGISDKAATARTQGTTEEKQNVRLPFEIKPTAHNVEHGKNIQPYKEIFGVIVKEAAAGLLHSSVDEKMMREKGQLNLLAELEPLANITQQVHPIQPHKHYVPDTTDMHKSPINDHCGKEVVAEAAAVNSAGMDFASSEVPGLSQARAPGPAPGKTASPSMQTKVETINKLDSLDVMYAGVSEESLFTGDCRVCGSKAHPSAECGWAVTLGYKF